MVWGRETTKSRQAGLISLASPTSCRLVWDWRRLAWEQVSVGLESGCFSVRRVPSSVSMYMIGPNKETVYKYLYAIKVFHIQLVVYITISQSLGIKKPIRLNPPPPCLSSSSFLSLNNPEGAVVTRQPQ